MTDVHEREAEESTEEAEMNDVHEWWNEEDIPEELLKAKPEGSEALTDQRVSFWHAFDDLGIPKEYRANKSIMVCR